MGAGSVLSLPNPAGDRTYNTPPVTEAYTFDLTRMTGEARALWLEVYGLGYCEGIEAGRRQVEDELAAEWAALRAEVLPRLRGPFAELAERRGQPERAARQRAILAERGVFA